MGNANALKVDDQCLRTERTCPQYSIVFDACDLDVNSKSCIIPVKSRREVELYLLSLGEEAEVIMNDQAQVSYPEVWEWLSGRDISEVLTELKWSYREEEEVIDIIEKIPLPPNINQSFLKLHNDEPDPERIEREYVHKTNEKNVLISKPYHCGNMFYFNGFTQSPEFNIDHYSDHLEGIIMFEVARQAGIASVHLIGFPINGIIVVLKAISHFYNFVDCSAPFIISTIPVYRQRKLCVGYCVYNIIQNGTSCAKGLFAAIGYNTKSDYQKFRNSLASKSAKEK